MGKKPNLGGAEEYLKFLRSRDPEGVLKDLTPDDVSAFLPPLQEAVNSPEVQRIAAQEAAGNKN